MIRPKVALPWPFCITTSCLNWHAFGVLSLLLDSIHFHVVDCELLWFPNMILLPLQMWWSHYFPMPFYWQCCKSAWANASTCDSVQSWHLQFLLCFRQTLSESCLTIFHTGEIKHHLQGDRHSSIESPGSHSILECPVHQRTCFSLGGRCRKGNGTQQGCLFYSIPVTIKIMSLWNCKLGVWGK